MELRRSKTGKHGGCKISFVALAIFTGKKYEEMYNSTDKVDIQSVIWAFPNASSSAQQPLSNMFQGGGA
jgi:hypothetical protein